MNILRKTRLIGAKPFAALPREKLQYPGLLDRECLKNKITKLTFPSEASDAFFRDSWSYYASDCKTRLRNIREGIWQNIDHVIPFHKRKESSAASTFFQEPRPNTLCHAPDNNFNVDRVYKEFLKCFHPERSLALDRKKKVKPEPKIKPKPKPTINQYSNEAAKMHCKYTPSYQKPRFASCHIFKYVTDRQLLEWEREANETKEVIKQTKDPYVMRELTKRLNRLNKLKALRALNTPDMERTSESMPKGKENKKLLKDNKRISPITKGPYHPDIDSPKRFQIKQPSLKSLPEPRARQNSYPLSIAKKKSAKYSVSSIKNKNVDSSTESSIYLDTTPRVKKMSRKDSVSIKNKNVDSSTESSIYLDPTPSVSTVEGSIKMVTDTPHSHEATPKPNTKYALQILEELPKPPNIGTKESYHLEISKSRIVSTITEPNIQEVGSDIPEFPPKAIESEIDKVHTTKRGQESHSKTHKLKKLKKSAKVVSHAKSSKVKLKQIPREKTLQLTTETVEKSKTKLGPFQKFNKETDDVTSHTKFHESLTKMLPGENSESALDSGILEFLKIQWEQNPTNNQIFDERYIKPDILEVIKQALKIPIEKDDDDHSEQIQNLTQLKISSKFRNDLSSFLKRRHQDETKNQLDKNNKFKGSRESVRTSELNLITPISGKHTGHNKRITLPGPKRLRILMRSFNRKIVYKNPYGKGRKLTAEQLAKLSRTRPHLNYLDTKHDEDTSSLYSTKSLHRPLRGPIYLNKSPISHISDVKTIPDDTEYPLPESKPMVISELVADFMNTRKMEDYFNNLYPGVIKPLLEDETPSSSDSGLTNPLPFDRPPTNRFHLGPDDFPIPKPEQKLPPPIKRKRKKQRVNFREKTKLIKKLDEEKEMCCLCKLIYGSSQKTLPPCPRYMKNMQRRVEKLQLRNYFVQKMLENAKASNELNVKDRTEPRTAFDLEALSSSYTSLKLCH